MSQQRQELIVNLRAHAAAIRHKVAADDLSMADIGIILLNQEYIMDALAEILTIHEITSQIRRNISLSG